MELAAMQGITIRGQSKVWSENCRSLSLFQEDLNQPKVCMHIYVFRLYALTTFSLYHSRNPVPDFSITE
ncbi:hypothetical protein GIB67_031213 [Kingdonia uniflora]|uniref:Uncharacterized protein n=1 Tax=Kingdonia uniflora TaxID=39325 RepID=A0A7J7NKU1_9MAGN|nr:hypothetical protein GIB67_031213 [Kingdonia uniflora]